MGQREATIYRRATPPTQANGAAAGDLWVDDTAGRVHVAATDAGGGVAWMKREDATTRDLTIRNNVIASAVEAAQAGDVVALGPQTHYVESVGAEPATVSVRDLLADAPSVALPLLLGLLLFALMKGWVVLPRAERVRRYAVDAGLASRFVAPAEFATSTAVRCGTCGGGTVRYQQRWQCLPCGFKAEDEGPADEWKALAQRGHEVAAQLADSSRSYVVLEEGEHLTMESSYRPSCCWCGRRVEAGDPLHDVEDITTEQTFGVVGRYVVSCRAAESKEGGRWAKTKEPHAEAVLKVGDLRGENVLLYGLRPLDAPFLDAPFPRRPLRTVIR